MGREMPRIDSDGKIRTGAFLVVRIHRHVNAAVEVGTDLGDQEAARGEPRARRSYEGRCAIRRRERALAARFFVHPPRRGRTTPDCAAAVAMPVVRRARDTVLQQHAGDADGRKPVADFRALEVDGQFLKPSPETPRRPRPYSCPSEHRPSSWAWTRCIRRSRGVRRTGTYRPARLRVFRSRQGLRIRWRRRPNWYLRMSARWLPDIRLPGARSYHHQ